MIYFAQSAQYNVTYGQFLKNFDATTTCLKHFLEKCRVLVNLIFNTKWFNLLFWHMNYLHQREKQTSTQGFPQVLRTWGGALQNLMKGGEGLSQYMGAMSTLPQFFREDFQQRSSIPPFIDKDKNKVSPVQSSSKRILKISKSKQ